MRDQRFTVVQLHSKLMSYRAAEGQKKLLRTPHHGVMSNKDKTSIRLSAIALPPDATSEDDTGPATHQEPEWIGDTSSRVLISVSFHRTGDDPTSWRDWLLSQLPGGIGGLSLVRPEEIWGGANSALRLFSLPVAVWDLLPNKFAYTIVGYVTTPNTIGTTIDSTDMGATDSVARALTGR